MTDVERVPAPDATASPFLDARRCPNCGAPAGGRFCAECGQETDLRLPTLGEFLRESAGRYVAFDGRFWRTMAALVFRPGRLTREYFAGRRRRYIRPARLYLFSTLLLFAVSRVFVEPTSVEVFDADAPKAGPGKGPSPKAERPKPATEEGDGFYLDDELQLHAPGGLTGAAALDKRWQRFNSLARNEKADQIVDGMLRYGPYAMFALLPAFAFLLKLVYLGRRRRHPHRPRLYGEHMVFAAHNHAFLFVAATALLLAPLKLLQAIILGWIAVYLFRSLRTIYGGSRFSAVARAVVLAVSYAILAGFATLGLLVAAILLR